MAQQVLMVGAGALGQAFARALPPALVQVTFWDLDESKCTGGRQPLEASVPASAFIFMCVPSWAMRGAVAQIAALVQPTTAVISLAKGLESPTAKTMDEVCAQVLPPGQPLAILGGAMLANEIGSGLPGMAMLACADDALAANIIALCQGSALQLTWTSDVHSVAVAGVLKNVYAIALGIGDGLGLGSNARGWLFAQAVQEMHQIAKLVQMDTQILLSVAGIGDLVATGLSPQSKNHTAGTQLAQTGRSSTECEGVMSFPSLLQLVGQRPQLRLLNALEAILMRNQNVRITMQELMYHKGA